ncbi:MAG: Mce-associated rane protein [Mycobacterium sp.]|jgi:Mce-associated membrane protein|nr:Mce-associated rane protein [Mycobacterium sp.]
MATKIFKRTNAKDVFDKLAEQDDPAATELSPKDIENPEIARDLDVGEPAESLDGDAEHADDTDDTEDTEDTGEGASVLPRRRRWLRRIVAAVAGVVVVAVLALSGFLAWQLKQNNDTAAAGRAALAAAQRYAVVLTSIDTNNVDQNFTQVLDGSTGEFKDVYSQSASQLRQVLIDNKAMSKGIVVDSAIKSATKTKVDVLLFVDQSVSNTANPEPRIDRSRVTITMELVDNHWLASKVDLK